MIMTTKGKVYTFYSIVIVLLVMALMVFKLNLYAKAVICFFILACLLIMRSVQKAILLPPDIDPDTMQPVKPLVVDEDVVDAEIVKSTEHNDSIDAYLNLMLRADKELSEDPSVDKDSPSYNNLLNARISEYLDASK